MDEATGEVTTEHEFLRQHPEWVTWVGNDQLRYARRTCGAALGPISGESWQDLADQATKRETELQDATPEAWL
jgi:hypothetical protein